MQFFYLVDVEKLWSSTSGHSWFHSGVSHVRTASVKRGRTSTTKPFRHRRDRRPHLRLIQAKVTGSNMCCGRAGIRGRSAPSICDIVVYSFVMHGDFKKYEARPFETAALQEWRLGVFVTKTRKTLIRLPTPPATGVWSSHHVAFGTNPSCGVAVVHDADLLLLSVSVVCGVCVCVRVCVVRVMRVVCACVCV